MRSFVRQTPTQRIVFGTGTFSLLSDEVDRLPASRVVVLSTRGQVRLAGRAADLLGARAVGRFPGAVPHTPVEVTEQAVDQVRVRRADAVVSVGGGSTTGLGKAVASRLGLAHLVVPTTYAGSELTPVLGETAGGEKTTSTGPEILPDAVLYDVELTTALPWSITLTSAVNAMAHAVEARYSPDATGETNQSADEAIRVLAGGLRAQRRDLGRLEARSDLLYGAFLGGTCLGAVGMGLHHKLCHVLGGTFDLPHAATHTVVLPYAMAYNEEAAPTAMRAIAAALSADHAPTAVQSLVRDLGGPTTLRALGLTEDDIPRAAKLAVRQRYPNPRPVTEAGVAELLQRALDGLPAATGANVSLRGPSSSGNAPLGRA